MKKRTNKDKVPKVLISTQYHHRQTGLLTTAGPAHSRKSQPTSSLEPIEWRYLGLVAAIHRLLLDTCFVHSESGYKTRVDMARVL